MRRFSHRVWCSVQDEGTSTLKARHTWWRGFEAEPSTYSSRAAPTGALGWTAFAYVQTVRVPKLVQTTPEDEMSELPGATFCASSQRTRNRLRVNKRFTVTW